MKIVLVDDETIVLQGISTIVKRLNRDWSVVAECSSGEDALPVIEKLCPDVVITDIRMYNISGIELAERIKRINQEILVILLTGYSEFDYAQKAVKLNIFDYLLKPTRYNDIIESLSRAEAYLGERKEKQKFQNDLIKKLSENKMALREKFLRDVMNGLLPRASIIAEILVLQGLSIILQENKEITAKQYIKWHPGGTLGQLKETEK